MTKFKDTDVKTESYIPFKGSRGVIKGVDVEISDHDLLEALGHYSISNVRRIKARRNGELKPTSAVILFFKTAKMPSEIFLGYEKKKITEFQPKVNRCFKCQRFGHSASMCNSTA